VEWLSRCRSAKCDCSGSRVSGSAVSKDTLHWRPHPANKDFEAALSFLCLVYSTAHATRLVRALRSAAPVKHAAKDLLRASGLPLLPRDEAHVAADLKRIHRGKPLSPVLLVQGDHTSNRPLLVADGYHRICAVCYFDEDAPINCVLVPGPSAPG
jgi:hypothetical protein